MDYQNLLDQLLPIVVVFLTGLVPVVLLVIRAYAKRWLDADISEKQSWQIETLVRDAISFAEEQASKAIKEGVPAPSRRSKLDSASDYLIKHARAAGLPEIATELIAEKIESSLGAGRDVEGKGLSDAS